MELAGHSNGSFDVKAFWILLSVIVIAGVGVVVHRSNAHSTPMDPEPLASARSSQGASSAVAPKTEKRQAPTAPQPIESTSKPAAAPALSSSGIAPTRAQGVILTPAEAAGRSNLASPTTSTGAPAAPAVSQASPAVAQSTPAAAPPAPAKPAIPAIPAADPLNPTGEIGSLGSYQDFEKKLAEQEAESKKAEATKPPAASPGELGVKIEDRPDGSKLVDGRFTIKGDGTQDKPYVITWEQFVAAQESYAPKEGKKEIPANLKMLDGKWVRVTGYVAFPLMVQQADELLSMMNQWDGCCIGTPPTPYDAIEVRLTSPVSGKARMTTFGSVTGIFKVDPHLVGGWLVGLYVMDRATLTPEGYGGFSP
jgi:hypothetical protein